MPCLQATPNPSQREELRVAFLEPYPYSCNEIDMVVYRDQRVWIYYYRTNFYHHYLPMPPTPQVFSVPQCQQIAFFHNFVRRTTKS